MSNKTSSQNKSRGGGTKNGKMAAPKGGGPASTQQKKSSVSFKDSLFYFSWKSWTCLAAVVLAIIVSVMQGSQESHTTPTSIALTNGQRSEPLPLLDLLFPFHSLDLAWEEYPLLSTVYGCDQEECTANDGSDDPLSNKTYVHHLDDGNQGLRIPTVYRDGRDARKRQQLLQNLISTNDLDSVLDAPNMIHGSDYHYKKMVIREDGAEWTGALAQHMVPINAEHRAQAIQGDGFSLIIDKLQQRWKTIAAFSRQLQQETSSAFGSCNLYLTPPPHSSTSAEMSRGFECHWDDMDVVVVQLEGNKLWSVANRPHPIQLSNTDQKYKPTLQDMQVYSKRRYREFLLQPGDVLYIPRGFMHNASSIDTTSLHVTFGIEHSCESTVEAMVHHAIELYATRNGNPAIPTAHECRGVREIARKDLLHMMVAEAARRDRVCDDAAAMAPSSCTLRRSVPRNKAFSEIAMMKQQSQHGKSDGDYAAFDDDYKQLIHTILQEAFETVLNKADVQETRRFLYRVENGDDGLISSVQSFCHPYWTASAVATVACLVDGVIVDGKELSQYIKNVRDFALRNPDIVQQQLDNHLGPIQRRIWNREDKHLKAAGQVTG